MSGSNGPHDGWLWGSGLGVNGAKGSLRVSRLFVPYHVQGGLALQSAGSACVTSCDGQLCPSFNHMNEGIPAIELEALMTQSAELSLFFMLGGEKSLLEASGLVTRIFQARVLHVAPAHCLCVSKNRTSYHCLLHVGLLHCTVSLSHKRTCIS